MTDVITIRALGDNFTYVHRYEQNRAFAVDPGEAAALRTVLQKHSLTLTTVLLTHDHWDHAGGVPELQSKIRCEVIAADRRLMPMPDRIVADGETFALGDSSVHVIGTPGHTASSVSYYVVPTGHTEAGVVYTGDTLFVGGCGRPIECDEAVMWRSLCRLAALPEETRVYCGHDYTLENYEFALTIVPDSEAFAGRLAELQKAVEYGRQTVPSTIAQEKATNIFLRADDPEIKTALGMADAPPDEVFAELRRRKNLFG